jgi:hypothetical protein
MPDWASLIATASATEVESLMRLFWRVAARHPDATRGTIMDYTSAAERRSVDRIVARIEGKPFEEPAPQQCPRDGEEAAAILTPTEVDFMDHLRSEFAKRSHHFA